MHGSGRFLRKFLTFILLGAFLTIPRSAEAEPLGLEILGVDDRLREVLNEGLEPPPVLNEEGQLNRRWLQHYQRQLPGDVRSLLEPYGYFYSSTDSQLVEVPTGGYRLRVNVEPGTPLRITSLDLDLTRPGGDLPQLKQRVAEFPLQVGDILRQDIYEEAKAELQQAAVSLGFLEARYTAHEIRVHLGERRADINLRLESGARFRFGETTYQGAENYPERYLQRFLAYRPSGFFSYEKIGQTQLNLYNADQFRQVEVRALTEDTRDQRVPVRIQLEPAPKHQLRPGIGYGTDTGARFSLKYRTLNLFHRGQELFGELLLAERRQSVLATYLIPDLRRADSETRLRLGHDREDTETYFSRKFFAEAEYQRAFTEAFTGSVFLRLSQEYSRIGGESNNSQLALPGVRLSWRQLDNPLAPRRGIHARLKIQGAQQGLLS
ncbi:MAG TPA: POTRA domain-containing protein, partial [Desulfuromonadales bacterium]|nr:POTRA domain-containing protein [Desulfuromonadales bacterium]